MRGVARRALLFLPSLALGVLGGVWLLLRPWPYAARTGLGGQLLAGAATAALLLAAAWLLERTLPSFRYASRLLESALRSVALPAWTALLLAAATAGAEELFFRGALMPLVGLVPQALLFGLFHPVPRRAWAYPVFAALAGLAFGALTLTTGSLLPAVVAHFGINLQGLWEVRRPGAATPRRPTGEEAGSTARGPEGTGPEGTADRTPPDDPAPDDPAPDDPVDRNGRP